MENQRDYLTGFRHFTGRVIFGWIFLVLVLTLILGEMPYQKDAPADAFFPWLWFRQGLSLIASTLVLVAFFIPGRLWSILAFVGLIFFNMCFVYRDGNAFYSFAWWAMAAPLCLSDRRIPLQLRALRLIMPFFLIGHLLTLKGFMPSALPLYTLYLAPYLPYERLFNSFEKHFEPR